MTTFLTDKLVWVNDLDDHNSVQFRHEYWNIFCCHHFCNSVDSIWSSVHFVLKALVIGVKVTGMCTSLHALL
jgi:hypothetical protein